MTLTNFFRRLDLGFNLFILATFVLVGFLLIVDLDLHLSDNPLDSVPTHRATRDYQSQTEMMAFNSRELINITRSLVIPEDFVDTVDVSDQLMQDNKIHMEACHELFDSKVSRSTNDDRTPLNTLVIFTGRWFFLRIQLPQVYRELRQNGGVIDRVWFLSMRCTDEDYKKLAKFAIIANTILKEKVFSFHKYTADNVTLEHAKLYGFAYCEMHAYLLKYPLNNYFKIDDDVVYIHPGAFAKAIEHKKQNPKCLVSLFNIAGGNWMCNRIYQDNGVFEGLRNPAKIDFNEVTDEGNVNSTLFALHSFLHYERLKQLDKLFFDSREFNERFTINAIMYDATAFDTETIREAGPVDFNLDEPWWTVDFPKAGEQRGRSNCIVGDALVVHFSHADRHLAQKILEKGILEEFESVVIKEIDSMKMNNDILWHLLEYTTYPTLLNFLPRHAE